MRNLTIVAVAAVLGLGSAACGSRAGSLDGAAEELGAANINAIEFSGNGRWYQFGQAPAPSGACRNSTSAAIRRPSITTNPPRECR